MHGQTLRFAQGERYAGCVVNLAVFDVDGGGTVLATTDAPLGHATFLVG